MALNREGLAAQQLYYYVIVVGGKKIFVNISPNHSTTSVRLVHVH